MSTLECDCCVKCDACGAEFRERDSHSGVLPDGPGEYVDDEGNGVDLRHVGKDGHYCGTAKCARMRPLGSLL